MAELKDDEYQCAVCGQIFKKTLPDEEVWKEFENNFGGMDKNDVDMVCDDCYKIVMKMIGERN